MVYDALIFDIDGTLWNASGASAKGWNAGLADLGIGQRVSAEQIGMVSGHPYEMCVDMLLPGLKISHPELLETLDQNEVEAIKAHGGHFFDGAIEGIKQLSNEYKIFIVSNCQGWYFHTFLDHSGLEPFINGFDCYGISGLTKGEMLSRMKHAYALKNPVYIGDTAGDESAAEQANIHFIFASWGFGEPGKYSVTVDSFAQLLEHLK